MTDPNLQAAMASAVADFSRAMADAAESFRLLSECLEHTVEVGEATLSTEQYERYIDLRKIGLGPLEALALVDASDDDIVRELARTGRR